MKKGSTLCTVVLYVLLPILALVGCQPLQVVPEPTPTPATEPAPAPTPTPTPTPAPAEFEVISLDIAPLEIMSGETADITAVVKNIGGSEGTYAAKLTVGGVTEETKEVGITPSSSEVVTFSLVKDTPGTYEISIGELSSSLVMRERLENELGIPIMHDDQQGTSVVTLASLINGCNLSGVALQEAKIGLIGLGAAGLSIGKFLLRYTGNPTLGTARTEASIKRHAEQGGIPSSLEEIMQTAEIVIATTGVGGLIEPRMVRQGQIIFALSNPQPEIRPELAIKSGAALAADGRMVNNLLGYPGIWRGTLDAKATTINYQMYIAAASAIAAVTPQGELVPNPLDAKAHLAVAHNVAKAAVKSGVAQRRLDEDYFESTDIKAPTIV